MNLSDLMDLVLLEQMIEAGFVRKVTDGDLSIYNYSAAAQYSRTWNEVTSQCRGLIVAADGTVVARPFPKFFNLAELEQAGALPEGIPVEITEKMDGSLGILYPRGEEWSVATRGSFSSDQAVMAEEWLADLDVYWDQLSLEETVLFEIIYPANRIVVDYGDRSELVLLAVLDTETGRDLDRQEWIARVGWTGAVAQTHEADLETLASMMQPNTEGFVIRWADGTRAKIKSEDYVRLHRIVTGMSTKTVWEHLSKGGTYAELVEKVPDELYPWLNDVVTELVTRFTHVEHRALHAFDAVKRQVGTHDRKAFALEAQKYPEKALLFKLLDGKEIRSLIWRQVEPEYRSFYQGGEDVA